VRDDVLIWKVNRFVKEQWILEAVKNIVFRNAAFLKTLFIELTANSNFPSLSQLDFSNFVQQMGLLDKNLQPHDIDRLFIAAKSTGEKSK